MKKRAIFLAVFLMLMSVSLAQALPVYTIDTTIGREGNGGPFLVTGSGLNLQSMCLETGEYITLGASYWGTIDNVVLYSSGAKGTSATLTDNTKRLYSYFLDHPGLSNDDKRNIQVAIWAYQSQPEGQPYYPVGYDPTTNYYYNNASTFTLDHQIMVLNLWTADNVIPDKDNQFAYDHRAQSQLIATPEPGMLILLCLGLIGLAGIRRKLNLH